MSKKLIRWSLALSIPLALPLVGLGACRLDGLMPPAGASSGAAADAGAELPAAEGAAESPDAGSAPARSGALSVSLVDAPAGRYREVNIDVQRIEIGDEAGAWIPLASPQRVIDLLQLQHGVHAELGAMALPPGRYPMLRLLLGDRSTVQLADGTVQPLRVPSGMQSGLKLLIDLSVQAADKLDLVLDFDAAESIHLIRAGKNDRYMLRPVLRAVLRQASGQIHGHLTAADTSQPLAGATVTAQVLDGAGQPVVLRRVLTAADGSYRLDLLPLGQKYVVIARAAEGARAYEIQHSGELALDLAHPDETFDAALGLLSESGGLHGTVTPMAGEGESDTCTLLQEVPGRRYILASDVTTQDAVESFRFPALPVGAYSVQCERRAQSSSGDEVVSRSQIAAAAVTANDDSEIAVSF
jgi:hypothetical protein